MIRKGQFYTIVSLVSDIDQYGKPSGLGIGNLVKVVTKTSRERFHYIKGHKQPTWIKVLEACDSWLPGIEFSYWTLSINLEKIENQEGAQLVWDLQRESYSR